MGKRSSMLRGPCHSRGDVLPIEVIKPAGTLCGVHPRHHASNRNAPRCKDLIDPGRTHRHRIGFGPAEHTRVKGEVALPVNGGEIVPCRRTWCAWRGLLLLLTLFRRLKESKDRALGVSDHGEAAHARDDLDRAMDDPSRLLEARYRVIDVSDADIAHPAGLCAVGKACRGLFEEAADRQITYRDEGIFAVLLAGILHSPAEDGLVESCRRPRVRSMKFVPEKVGRRGIRIEIFLHMCTPSTTTYHRKCTLSPRVS